MKKFLKKLLIFIAVIILISLVVLGILCYKGYIMYKSAVSECPIEQKVFEIKSIDNYTKLSDLPNTYKDAVLCIEDRRFYNHGAIDLLSITRAIFVDIKTLSFKEGGSSITQQFAKNAYLSQSKKIERKFAEIFIAYYIEDNLSKDEIFELYLNSIYYGRGYYCIYDASMGYFNKPPIFMTDKESTFLAGIPNAPSVYSSSANRHLSLQRQKQVINKMLKYNKITKEKADILLNEISEEENANS